MLVFKGLHIALAGRAAAAFGRRHVHSPISELLRFRDHGRVHDNPGDRTGLIGLHELPRRYREWFPDFPYELRSPLLAEANIPDECSLWAVSVSRDYAVSYVESTNFFLADPEKHPSVNKMCGANLVAGTVNMLSWDSWSTMRLNSRGSSMSWTKPNVNLLLLNRFCSWGARRFVFTWEHVTIVLKRLTHSAKKAPVALALTALAAVLSASPAEAAIDYNITAGTFADGGTFSGTFTFDDSIGFVTNFDITTSSTAFFTGQRYTQSTGFAGNNINPTGSTVLFGNTVTDYYIQLMFSSPLASGLSGSITGNYECNNCGTFRFVTGGTYSQAGANEISQGAVPEPSTWAMMLVGFGAIGYGMRRRRQKVSVRFQTA